MNARWKRTCVLVAGVLLTVGCGAISVWQFYETHTLGTSGLFFLPAMQAPNQPPNQAPPEVFGMGSGAVVMVVSGSAGEKAGIRPNDRIITINGIPVSDIQQLAALDAATRRDDVVLYRLRRGPNEITAPLKLDSLFASPTWLANTATQVAVGVVFLIVGWLVFLQKPDDRRSVVFFALSVFSGVVFINLPIYINAIATRLGWHSIIPSPKQMLICIPALFGSLLVPIFLHLALIFPKEHRLVQKHPAILRWIYLVPPVSLFATLTVFIVGVIAGKAAPSMHGYAAWITITGTIAGLALFLRARHRKDSQAYWKVLIDRPFLTLSLLCAILLWLQLAAQLLLRLAAAGTLARVVVAVLFLLAPALVFFLFVVGYPVLACLALFTSYRASGAEEKRQLKWPLWGVVVSLGGRGVLQAIVMGLYYIAGYKQLMAGAALAAHQVLNALLAVLIPVSFAVAIFKYRLMEIDLIIKRTVLYSLLTGIIVSLYFVLVGGLGGLVVRFTPMKGESVAVLATVLVAAVFLPIRSRVQQMVDRRFFRKRHDYPQILQTLRQQIPEAAGRKALAAVVVESAQQALISRAVAFFLVDETGGLRVAAKIGLPEPTAAGLSLDPSSPAVQGLSGITDVPKTAWPQKEMAVLENAGSKILAPVRFQGELLGVLSLAAKLSGEDYDADDRDFLGALADQAAAGMDTQRLREQEGDFEKGREIQQALLPKQMPTVEGYSIAGAWQPARRVSGDYYDVFPLGNGKLGLCIADVAGKGLPAALLMSNLQAAVRSVATETVEPKKLCETINRVICGNVVDGRFITFFFGVLNPPGRRLVYTNAGHNPPLLVRGDGSVIRLGEGGPVLGVFQNSQFAQEELALSPGDRLLLFTDGVSEAANAEPEEFGEERLAGLLRESRPEDAEALQSQVMQSVTQFCANRFQDDATVVVLVVGTQASSRAGSA